MIIDDISVKVDCNKRISAKQGTYSMLQRYITWRIGLHIDIMPVVQQFEDYGMGMFSFLEIFRTVEGALYTSCSCRCCWIKCTYDSICFICTFFVK